MNNDIVLREYPREGPSTINVSSRRENRNLQSAAVYDPVCQYPAGASNISNEYEIVEFEDHMLGAHMVHPNKICRICGRGWPDLWMPKVCNCSDERSVVHPVCMQYHAIDKINRRCSVCGVDQFSEREKKKGEEGKEGKGEEGKGEKGEGKEQKREDIEQEESNLCRYVKACCSDKRYCWIGVLMSLAICLILSITISYANVRQIKEKH